MFTKDQAVSLLNAVGGKDNIVALTHCVTRMRFVLKEDSKADIVKIEELSFVKGTFTSNGQFQVIIGTEVADFYQVFTSVNQVDGISKEEAKKAAKKNMKLYERALANIAEIFVPLLPAIIAGGLILGFRNIIGDIKMFDGKSLAELSQFWAGTYNFLWLIAQAIFHYLPVGICWSITKKMGASQILGIVLGLTLISPQLLPAGQIGQVTPDVWNFGFVSIAKVGYQSQVIPSIFAAISLVYIERFMKKITPAAISMVIVPFVSIMLSVILAHALIGPIGRMIGDGLGNVIATAVTGDYKILFSFVFGFFYAPLVITGLHHINTAINLQLIETMGCTPIFPMVALSNIAQASAVLGIILVNKSQKEREISIPSCISGYLGVTEPALYGVNLKYKFPLICGCIGSAIAACVITVGGTMANSIGVGGLPAILSIQPQFWAVFAIGMVISVVVPCILTMIIYKRKFKTGQVEAVEELNDEIFGA